MHKYINSIILTPRRPRPQVKLESVWRCWIIFN